MVYEQEDIPDGDNLFKRISRNVIRDGKPFAQAFKNVGEGMSTNWSKYADANRTRIQGRGELNPGKYGVLSMRVGHVRAIPGQFVVHTPDADNRAHTDVEGEKTAEARYKYYEIATLVIQPEIK